MSFLRRRKKETVIKRRNSSLSVVYSPADPTNQDLGENLGIITKDDIQCAHYAAQVFKKGSDIENTQYNTEQ